MGNWGERKQSCKALLWMLMVVQDPIRDAHARLHSISDVCGVTTCIRGTLNAAPLRETNRFEAELSAAAVEFCCLSHIVNQWNLANHDVIISQDQLGARSRVDCILNHKSGITKYRTCHLTSGAAAAAISLLIG